MPISKCGRKNQKFAPADRERMAREAAENLRNGIPVAWTARLFEVKPNTLQYWLRQLEEGRYGPRQQAPA